MRFAVFGNPIAHSLSPLIHEHFASQVGLNLTYERILVDRPFATMVTDFFEAGGNGCNVTVPCKLEAFALATRLSDNAQAAGAVNTLKRDDDGSISGFNTDGQGLVRDLQRLHLLKDKARVLILGAGGAAQGIVRPLLEAGVAHITMVNRQVTKAANIAAHFPSKVEAQSYQSLNESLAAKLSHDHQAVSFDLIINATSSSLLHVLPPIEALIVQQAGAVYDLMYTPQGETIFTRFARDLGVGKTADGIGMLIAQAALSFEIWTGKRPDIAKTIAYLQAYLQERH